MRTNKKLAVENLERREVFTAVPGVEGFVDVSDPQMPQHFDGSDVGQEIILCDNSNPVRSISRANAKFLADSTWADSTFQDIVVTKESDASLRTAEPEEPSVYRVLFQAKQDAVDQLFAEQDPTAA